MDRHTANQIIETHQLIPGRISKNILLSIVNKTEIHPDKLPSGISIEQIKTLRHLYEEKAKEIDLSSAPRYLPFYHIIQDKMPNFSWEVESNANKKSWVNFNGPRINNLRPSLLSLLLEKINSDHDTHLHRKYRCINQLPLTAIHAFENFILDTEALYPSEEDMQTIITWLLACLSGSESTIFIPICPDYSYELTGDPSCPAKHTFDTLGTGNGLIAQRILSVLPLLKKFLTTLNLKVNIVAGLGDFEAFSEDNLTRLKLSKQEFLRRVKCSQESLIKACPIEDVTVIMITDLCDETTSWEYLIQTIRNQFEKNDFGKTQITKKTLLEMAEKRSSLYSRWYGKRNVLEEYIPIALTQGLEYAAMGMLIAKHYQNCLVLGADNEVMRYFYSIEKTIPTLYLKRFYC